MISVCVVSVCVISVCVTCVVSVCVVVSVWREAAGSGRREADET